MNCISKAVEDHGFIVNTFCINIVKRNSKGVWEKYFTNQLRTSGFRWQSEESSINSDIMCNSCHPPVHPSAWPDKVNLEADQKQTTATWTKEKVKKISNLYVSPSLLFASGSLFYSVSTHEGISSGHQQLLWGIFWWHMEVLLAILALIKNSNPHSAMRDMNIYFCRLWPFKCLELLIFLSGPFVLCLFIDMNMSGFWLILRNLC